MRIRCLITTNSRWACSSRGHRGLHSAGDLVGAEPRFRFHTGQALEGPVGAPELGHDAWYDYAEEWDGTFNSKVPGPTRSRCSNRVRQSDYAAVKAKVDHIRGIAAVYGREVQVWMSSSVVVRATEREALDYLDYYAVEYADLAALASQQRDPELPARLRALPVDERRAQLHRLVAGSFNMQILVGTPAQIADRLISLSRVGVDGINMTFVNYQLELHLTDDDYAYRARSSN